MDDEATIIKALANARSAVQQMADLALLEGEADAEARWRGVLAECDAALALRPSAPKADVGGEA